MRINRVVLEQFDVKLRTPLVSSRGAVLQRSGLVLGAETDEGTIGFGEISPLTGFSNESLDEVYPLVITLRRRLVGRPIPAQLSELRLVFPGRSEDRILFPSVALGIDTLFADLAAKAAKVRTAMWINRHARQAVAVNAILSGPMEQIDKQLKEKVARGYRTYKLKIGAEDAAIERDKVAMLRDKLGPEIKIRLDANRAFGCDQAVRFLRDVAQFDIEYVEEPLAADLWSHLSDLRKESPIPIALDESLSDRNIGHRSWGPRERCRHFVESGALDVAVIKPMLSGGICEVVDLHEELAQSGIKMVISSLLETGVGLAALLHLTAALGTTSIACGLDTLDLLADSMISESLPLENGHLDLPSGSGLGVTYRAAKALG